MQFDHQAMWSTNNGRNFKGAGIYMNSIDENFSLGQSLWFDDGDGFLGDLTVSGDITNTNNDFSLTSDGYAVANTNSYNRIRAYKIEHGSTDVLRLWGNATQVNITAETSFLSMQNGGGRVTIQNNQNLFEQHNSFGTTIESAIDITLDAPEVVVENLLDVDEVEIATKMRPPRYTDTTRPSNPEPGDMIYNSDYEGIQVGGENENWINL